MVFVALLRGINVGGNNKVDMKLLKAGFERVGFESVKTYINSGNIVFESSKKSEKKLAEVIHNLIHEDFDLDISVLVRSFEQYQEVMKMLPDEWQNNKEQKSDVLFLFDDVDDESVLNELVIKEGIDEVVYVSGALLWHVDRKHQTKSGLMQLVGTKLYKQMTVRNVNTVRKIYGLMMDLV